MAEIGVRRFGPLQELVKPRGYELPRTTQDPVVRRRGREVGTLSKMGEFGPLILRTDDPALIRLARMLPPEELVELPPEEVGDEPNLD